MINPTEPRWKTDGDSGDDYWDGIDDRREAEYDARAAQADRERDS